MKYDQWPQRWVKSENNNAQWVSGLCREIKKRPTQRLLLQELQGRKVEEGKKAGEEGSHPQLLCGCWFYPLSWLWGVPCKKDLGPIKSTCKCQMEMVCVLLLRLFYIRKSFMGINQKKRELKHSFFDLGGWSFNMKSLCCSSFSFSVASLPITQCLLMWRPEAARFYNPDQDA